MDNAIFVELARSDVAPERAVVLLNDFGKRSGLDLKICLSYPALGPSGRYPEVSPILILNGSEPWEMFEKFG